MPELRHDKMAASWSAAAAGWLELILQERYGKKFRLQHETGNWQLSLLESDKCIMIASDPVMFQRADSELPIFNWDAQAEGWQPVLGKSLPAPSVSGLPQPLIETIPTGFQIHYDVLGLAYWMLTRQEEVGRSDLDEHGRFPATSSHAFKHGYLERPIVDEWLDILGQVIKRNWPEVELKQHAFSMKVSHDVDAPSRYGFASWKSIIRGVAGDLLKRQDARGLLAPWIRLTTGQQLHPQDNFNTFGWIMTQSERHGLTSAFYFICGQKGTYLNADYDVGHPAIRHLIRNIYARGHEIGLHPSYGSYLKPERIAEEADHLRKVCREEGVTQAGFGGRMHYLQWRQPETLRAWDEAAMSYDSTLGYADHAGFRCGTCYEYPAFDPVEQQSLSLRIRPLVCMEGSIIGEKYMNLGVTDAAFDKMQELKSHCGKVNGIFSLLWHNSSFQKRAELELYKSILAS